MSQAIVLSGVGTDTHGTRLARTLRRLRPGAIGLVSAFVTLDGLKEFLRIVPRTHACACRLVAGTDHAITHPRALYLALENGWSVRLGKATDSRGIFHPK